jgi:hypothetical protein
MAVFFGDANEHWGFVEGCTFFMSNWATMSFSRRSLLHGMYQRRTLFSERVGWQQAIHYLMTLSVNQIMWHQMVRLLVGIQLKMIWKKQSWTNLTSFHIVCQERLRKPRNIPVRIHSVGAVIWTLDLPILKPESYPLDHVHMLLRSVFDMSVSINQSINQSVSQSVDQSNQSRLFIGP